MLPTNLRIFLQRIMKISHILFFSNFICRACDTRLTDRSRKFESWLIGFGESWREIVAIVQQWASLCEEKRGEMVSRGLNKRRPIGYRQLNKEYRLDVLFCCALLFLPSSFSRRTRLPSRLNFFPDSKNRISSHSFEFTSRVYFVALVSFISPLENDWRYIYLSIFSFFSNIEWIPKIIE